MDINDFTGGGVVRKGSLTKLTIVCAFLVAAAGAILYFRPVAQHQQLAGRLPIHAAPLIDRASRSKTAALAFRAIVIEAPELAQPILAQMPAGLGARNPSAALGALAWETFFAATVIHIGAAASDHPIFVYYNPFTDSAVVGVWDFSQAGAPAVTSICAITGSSVDGAAHSIARYPEWRKAADPFGNLASILQVRMRVIDDRFPTAGTGSVGFLSELCSNSQQTMAELRLSDTMNGLTDFARSQAKPSLAGLLKTASASSRSAIGASLPQVPPTELDVLVQAAPVFGKFKPAIALESEDRKHYFVVLVDSRSAQQFLIIEIVNDGRAWGIRHFTGLSFAT